MAETLSQSQIDALLASAFSGNDVISVMEEKSEQKYHKYDFYSPKKFTKDKLNILKSVYENYSKIASSRINSLVRVSSEVEFIAVEEERYHEFSNALSDTDALTIIKVKLPDGTVSMPIFMHISVSLMLNMMDRMLGGLGEEVANFSSSYVYTDIEISLYNNIARYLIAMMQDAWSNYLELDFEIERIETSHGLMQDIGMDEIVVIVILEVRINEMVDKINICMPAVLLSSIYTLIESKKAPQGKLNGGEDKTAQQIFSIIKDSTLDVTAKIGDATISLKEVYDLKEGDIINMIKPKNSDVDIYVDENRWFKGKLGVHNKNIAIRVSDLYKE